MPAYSSVRTTAYSRYNPGLSIELASVKPHFLVSRVLFWLITDICNYFTPRFEKS